MRMELTSDEVRAILERHMTTLLVPIGDYADVQVVPVHQGGLSATVVAIQRPAPARAVPPATGLKIYADD